MHFKYSLPEWVNRPICGLFLLAQEADKTSSADGRRGGGRPDFQLFRVRECPEKGGSRGGVCSK